ncbi:MAG: phospholipid carrier-dependent glycosyltransferase [Synechococcales cyanobacterium CRU_2_2]|nr:phospholipid carrier-dependent glycosyltransferase [Synechococcales cyanobacterium CRU_2_2]
MSPPLLSSPLLSSALLRRHWFSLSLSIIFLGALGLRLWGLDRINQLVFDEVYYVKYGVNYLTQQPVFDAHPPLGKYLIALGIWLGENVWFRGAEIRNSAAGLDLSPLSYRWLNGAVGALIPPLVAGVALQLTGRRRLAVLAGIFAALDGFLLVESRLALLHVYLVAFGMLGQWCFLQAWRSQNSEDRSTPCQWLLNAGLSFGACVSIKWNGLGYWLIPMLFWLGTAGILKIGLGARHWDEKQHSPSRAIREMPQPWGSRSLISRWEPRQFLIGAICLVLIPILFYTVLWLPHLRYQTEANFVTVHQQMLGFHRGMDDEAAAAHPYCSAWWSWPLLLRPMAYFFEKSADQRWRYSLYALGNPILWWLTTGAIASSAQP